MKTRHKTSRKKIQKYHTVVAVSEKNNRKIVETEAKSIPPLLFESKLII
jgi:hypothetical protein